MKLRYSYPAPVLNENTTYSCGENSWEHYSLPLGNGFFGASVFGRTDVERIQISEPSLANPWYRPTTLPQKGGAAAAGVNSFADIYLDFGHSEPQNYERELCLEEAINRTSYTYHGVKYEREAFLSYPDRVLAVRLSADRKGALAFDVRADIPFLGEYTIEPGDGLGKSGCISVNDNTIVIDGNMEYYGIEYYGVLKVTCDGSIESTDSAIKITDATSALLIFTCDTNYELCEQVFSRKDPKQKLEGKTLDREACRGRLSAACEKKYSELRRRHIEDYRALYSRVSLNICADEAEECKFTNELVSQHNSGKRSAYLQMLLFQYGRYLLISSSRSRLPAHLQGIWNAFSDSPWSCGYWHNINVQMNYWLSGPANITECFAPYISYAKAFMKKARTNADNYIGKRYPERRAPEGQNGWIIGTGGWAYEISGFSGGGHSGPGTGAFTSLLFWDYYDYTRDEGFLRDFAYKALYEMSVFFERALVECDGKYLIEDSASPENKHGGVHYKTVGCAFDQQMVYENFKRTLQAAEILGEQDSFIDRLREILDKLEPVLIGDDGQVKEYREETYYASIGEPNHRHISHLVGLYPATVINATTSEWMDAAKVTLTKRGDKSTGWAVAHRLLLWARTKTPKKCLDMIDSFIANNLNDNLWCTHPPFQIDGNFGIATGIAEMLLQSHSGYIELLPSIPEEWHSGSFAGLAARGNFVVDCTWCKGKITEVRILSRKGGILKISVPEHLLPSDAVLSNGIYEREMAENEIFCLVSK